MSSVRRAQGDASIAMLGTRSPLPLAPRRPSGSSGRPSRCLLYGCTPLFILFGRGWRNAPARGWVLLPALLLVAVLGALPWILPLIHIPEQRVYERGIVTLAINSFSRSYYVLAAAAMLSLLVLLFRRGTESWRAVLGAGLNAAFAGPGAAAGCPTRSATSGSTPPPGGRCAPGCGW